VRILCVIISLALHVAVLAAGVQLARRFPVRFVSGESVYQVGLVELEPDTGPPPLAQPGPETAPAAPPSPAAVSAARPAAPAAAKPVPTPAPPAPAASQPEAAPAARSAPAPPPSGAAGAAPKAISPRMDPDKGLLEQMDENAPDPVRPESLPTAVEKDGTIHVAGTHGFATFADTFNLDRCGADTFTPEDYYGHYRVGSRRFVSVIAAGGEEGGFLFYDSQSGMFRRLTRVSNMIFTYGPSFGAAKPVDGSVTILPKKDRYQDKHIKKPNQLIWLPEDPPMRYGTMIEFAESEVRFTSGGTILEGTLVTRPEGERVPGVVLAFCTGCVPREKARGFAQALALHGLAVLVYDVRACAGELPPGEAGLRALAEDALAAVRALKARPEVDPGRVGLWGKDNGAQVALAAASMGVEADFLVLTYAQAGPTGQVPLPLPPRPAGVLIPALWLFSGTDPDILWREHVQAVEQVRDTRGRAFSVELLPDLDEGASPDAPALQPLSLRYGRIAAPWIKGLR